MTLEEAYYVASILAALAVVVSLVFLAVQIQLNTKAIRAASEYDVQIRWSYLNLEIGYNPDRAALVQTLYDETTNLDGLTEEERVRLHFLIRSILQRYQAHHFLYVNGSLPKGYWDTDHAYLKRFIKLPVVKTFLAAEASQGILRPEFLIELSRDEGGAADLPVGVVAPEAQS